MPIFGRDNTHTLFFIGHASFVFIGNFYKEITKISFGKESLAGCDVSSHSCGNERTEVVSNCAMMWNGLMTHWLY